MSYGLERLKEIGAQKIHEKTHISRDHVQAVLHETFDGFNKIHFLGFISILEREYDVDLSDLKAKGIAYYSDARIKPFRVNNSVFTPDKKKKNRTLLYIILTILLFGVFSYFDLIPSMGENTEIQQIDNTMIENAQQNLEPVLEPEMPTNVFDTNESLSSDAIDENISDTNTTEDVKNEAVNTEVEETVKSLKIIPRQKVWMGYVDIKTRQKNQKTTEDEIILDAKKDWLFLFGHGKINVEVDGKMEEFNSGQNMRFKYIDGNFSQITIEEFKELNKDIKW